MDDDIRDLCNEFVEGVRNVLNVRKGDLDQLRLNKVRTEQFINRLASDGIIEDVLRDCIIRKLNGVSFPSVRCGFCGKEAIVYEFRNVEIEGSDDPYAFQSVDGNMKIAVCLNCCRERDKNNE